MTRADLLKNIDTIVIVMMENRSYDHLLGHLSMPEYGGRKDLDGIPAIGNPDYLNASRSGAMVGPFKADDQPFPNDLPHERAYVKTQLATTPAGQHEMNGFVEAYEDFTGTTGVLRPPVMGLLTPEYLPTTNFLAWEYLVCDRWFAPLPTSTQPNRLMAVSGYTLREGTHSGLLPDQDTFFDWLDNHQVPWRIYSAGLSFFTLMKKMWPSLLSDEKARPLGQLAHDVQHEDSSSWPKVLFVEPDYGDSPIHLSGHACDNHPPVPVAFGEVFLKHVYEALTSNPARWGKTLMIVTYDEHGGFFDHVEPLPVPFAPMPGADFAEAFTSTGVRVPTLVVSPWVAPGTGSRVQLDHTSMLQLLAERFGKEGEPYSAPVEARRKAGIGSVSQVLTQTARGDVPVVPGVALQATVTLSNARDPVTANQQAFTAALEAFTNECGKPALEKYPELAHWQAVK